MMPIIMKGILAAALALASAMPISKRSDNGVVEIHAKKRINHKKQSSTLQKLKTSLPEADLNFTGIEYLIDYEIGDQKMTGIMDTGSSDTWVFSTAAGKNQYTFDPSAAAEASGYTWLDNSFSAAYGDGSNTISGSWAKDTVTVGGASVEDYQFAFANNSSPDYFPDNIAIFGLSVEQAETRTPNYTPFTERLKEQGTIDSYAYTIFTGDKDSSEGTLLLGGIDSAKINGSLYTLPRSTGGQLGSLASDYLTVDTTYGDQTFQAIWDTGTSQTLLPQSIADDIASTYGFSYSENEGGYIAQGTPDVSGKPPVKLSFSGFEIEIPTEDMILESTDGISLLTIGRGINELFYELYILGDAVLKQISFTFDPDNDEYAVGLVKHTDESNIEAISGSIPGAQSPPKR